MAPATRKSSRLSGKAEPSSSPVKDDSTATAGQKRKAGTISSVLPESKRGKKNKQPTLEETKNGVEKGAGDVKDANQGIGNVTEDPEHDPETVQDHKQDGGKQADESDDKDKQDELNVGDNDKQHVNGTSAMDDTGKISKDQDSKEAKDKATASKTQPTDTIEVDKQRKQAEPSNILEKGIIYFFIRARVNAPEHPEDIKDIQRAYMVLRPLPDGTKLHEGPIPELKNCRLLALPKKVWPKGPKDRFMCFVEKAGTDVADLKKNFMDGSDYDTKTTGTSHTPPVTPVGEGVYAMTTQGRDSHLAYMLTVPDAPGEVQQDIGIADKGSFVLSVKNPTIPGPANANLPQGPEFPSDILDEFRSLRWMGCQPKHLDYPNAQVLLIGEALGQLGRAVEPASKDQKHEEKETPAEELEKLEDEDQFRAEAFEGDAIFADLGVKRDEYPKLQTTW